MRTLIYAHFYEVVLTQNFCVFSSRKSFFNARLATKSIWLHIDLAFNLYEDYLIKMPTLNVIVMIGSSSKILTSFNKCSQIKKLLKKRRKKYYLLS